MNKSHTSIHDTKARQQKAVSMITQLMGGLNPQSLNSAMKLLFGRYKRHCGATSRYKSPHQGAKECERRRRQKTQGTHGCDTWLINERRLNEKRAAQD